MTALPQTPGDSMGRRGQNDASANNRGHSRPLRAASYGRGCGYSGRSVTMECSSS